MQKITGLKYSTNQNVFQPHRRPTVMTDVKKNLHYLAPSFIADLLELF